MLTDDLVRQAREATGHRLGLDIPAARAGNLDRGLQAAFGAALEQSPQACLRQLVTMPDHDPALLRLAAHLTVGETHFFRDRPCFDALTQELLPGLIAEKRRSGNLQLRIWSAGCATGEEAYSLAILLDQLLPDRDRWTLTILGTDINPRALAAAQRGVYTEWSLRHTSPALRQRAFGNGGTTLELVPSIRQMVRFSLLNLAGDRYPDPAAGSTEMDLILCRNVLMYFTPAAAAAAAGRLQQALAPGGWLLMAPVEASAELFQPLIRHCFPGAIFFRKEGPRSSSAPALSAPDPLPVRLTTPNTPGTASVRRHGGRVHGSRPTPTEAERRAPLESPPTADLMNQAQALADQGQLTEAEALCKAVLAGDPLQLEAYLLLGAIYQERDDPSAAAEALRRATYLAPDCAPAYFLLGRLQARQGDLKRAQRSMKTVESLLGRMPPQQTLPGAGGMTAGGLLAAARVSQQAPPYRLGPDPQSEG